MLIEVDTAADAKGKPARLLRPALARGLVIGRSWQSERSLIDALPAHDGSDCDIEQSLKFYRDGLGLTEIRRVENEKGRFTLIFLAAPEDKVGR